MRLIPFLTVCLLVAAPVAAKPALKDVREIDDGLMQIAIADEIRKSCSNISARMIRAMGRLNALERKAKDLGYSKSEIDAYVNSKAEKKRMRAKATSYLKTKGVNANDTKALCRFGKSEISRGTAIGSLLR